MPRKKMTILVPAQGLTHLIAKTFKRYRDANMWSNSARMHIADDVYHVICEYISDVNQGIIDENPVAPKPKKRQVLSLTPEQFKAKQEGRKVELDRTKEDKVKKPSKNLEQNIKRRVRPTRVQQTVDTGVHEHPLGTGFAQKDLKDEG